MDITLDVNKLLDLTRVRLNDVTTENIMLHCLVEQQQAEIIQLKMALDELGLEVKDAEDQRKQDSSASR